MDTEFGDIPEAPTQGWRNYRRRVIEQAELRYLEHSLRRYRGDVNAIARDMQLTRRSIYLKLSKYRLALNQYRA